MLLSMQREALSELRMVSVFSHLNAEKAELYRAILRAFMEAKASFALHLRPADVRAALRTNLFLNESDDGGLDAALGQLCEWRNLEAHRDTADVTTVEEFYRPRFLYQLTWKARPPNMPWPCSSTRSCNRENSRPQPWPISASFWANSRSWPRARCRMRVLRTACCICSPRGSSS